jgi:aspartate/methionine/tyrosine aminotransferase
MKSLSASATITINGIAAKKRMNGERVYNFAAGDPMLTNHPAIIERAARQLQSKFQSYPPVEGIAELRSLAAQWVNTTCHTRFSKENVMVTCGGKFALFASIYTLLEPGEEVLIAAPYWVSYPDIVKIAGGVPKIIQTHAETGWKLTADDLYQNATKNTKMLIFNNACNPTGVVYTKQEVHDLLNAAKKLDLIVVSDEVYSGLVYEEEFISCGSFPEHDERVIIVQSCSKNFGMTGWRIGFALAPEWIIKKLAVLQSQSTTAVSLVSQWAAVGALEKAEEVNTYVKEAMKARRDVFVRTFNSLFQKEKPLSEIKSALYAFVPLDSLGIRSTHDSVGFCEKLIASDNIALVPGIAFGVDGYVRFAFSESEEEIAQGLHALKKAIDRLS